MTTNNTVVVKKLDTTTRWCRLTEMIQEDFPVDWPAEYVAIAADEGWRLAMVGEGGNGFGEWEIQSAHANDDDAVAFVASRWVNDGSELHELAMALAGLDAREG